MKSMKNAILPQSMESKNQIKIDLLSGFRGAGKTRFLREMEKNLWRDERVILLINEKGNTAIDQSELRENHFVEYWQGGCICCTSSLYLMQRLRELADLYTPDRIVIEMTETGLISDLIKIFTEMTDIIATVEHVIYVVNDSAFLKRWNVSEGFVTKQLMEKPLIIFNTFSSGKDFYPAASLIESEFARAASYYCKDFERQPMDFEGLYVRSRRHKKITF